MEGRDEQRIPFWPRRVLLVSHKNVIFHFKGFNYFRSEIMVNANILFAVILSMIYSSLISV